jgi:hypothetical protein
LHNIQWQTIFSNRVLLLPRFVTDIDNKELDLLVKSGFNTIHIDVRDTSNCVLFFDQCYKKGLKIVAQFGSKTGEHSMGDVSCLSVYKNHPVLLGWSIADDANNGHYSIDSTKMRHDSVKAARPELFTFLSVYENYEKGISFAPHEFLRTGDVLAFEMYPIDNWGQALGAFTQEEELVKVERELDTFQKINFRDFNKILVAIPQTFSWANFSDNKAAMLPTPEELRSITYTGLINGAKGVLNYTFGIPGSLVSKSTPDYKLTLTGKLWEECKLIAKEINILKEIYLKGSRTKVDLGKDSRLSLAYWKYGNTTYVIVSNLDKTKSQFLDYKLAVKGNIHNAFFWRKATLIYKQGSINGNISPQQVQVYQIKQDFFEQ